MLGCMCAAAAPGLLTGRDKQQQVLELFSVALGPTAAEAVTNAAATAGGWVLKDVGEVWGAQPFACSWLADGGPPTRHASLQQLAAACCLESCTCCCALRAATVCVACAHGHAGDGCDGPEPGPGDLELAVACWWRAAALQALSAYVMGVMGKGLAEDATQQVSCQ